LTLKTFSSNKPLKTASSFSSLAILVRVKEPKESIPPGYIGWQWNKFLGFLNFANSGPVLEF
jgi:hypothetical protein